MGRVNNRGAVAAPQSSAAEAGMEALAAGGNALDAALAAALSLTVSYPNNCALGGDLIALVHTADGRTVEVNASGPAARATDAAAVRRRSAEMPIHGPDPVTVPGLIGGLHAVWQAGALLPWASAFDVAVRQAAEGVPVAPSLAAALRTDRELLAADDGCRAVFLTGRHLAAAGDLLRQPALAASLRSLAADGPSAFYDGWIGASLLQCLQASGSALAADDLARFAPVIGEPLRAPLGAGELVTSKPNTQGFLLPLILGAAAEADPALDPLGASAAVLARIMAAAVADRDRHLCDPVAAPVPIEELLDPARLRALAAAAARPDQPDPATTVGRARGPARGDTVAVVAADAAGNAVCLIQSLFHAFGAGIMDPGTGILVHNRGAFFSLDPDSPNVLAPGKRPAHTLMPAMVLRGGRPSVVLGTMGGGGQPQILAHVLLQHLRGKLPADAVDAPRWVVGGLGAGSPRDQLLMERRVPRGARDALLGTGMPVRELADYDENVGHAQMISIAENGSMLAASDPRSEGAGLVSPDG